MQHNLVAYTLRIHPTRESDLRLGWLDGDESPPRSLISVLQQILSPGTEWREYEDTPQEISGRVSSLVESENAPTIYGRIRVGGRGERSDVTKVTGEEFEVWIDDEISRPVFFWLTAPPASRTALILTERIGRFGVRTAFWDKFVLPRLRESLPDRIPVMAQWYPKRVFEEYLRHGDGLSGATLRKGLREEDENRAIDEPIRYKKLGTLDLVVRRKFRPAREVMERLLGNQLGMDEAIELILPPEDVSGPVKTINPDELILKLDFDNRRPMTISLTRDRTPRAGWPVGAVERGPDGYPSLEGMALRAKEVQDDVASLLGWG